MRLFLSASIGFSRLLPFPAPNLGYMRHKTPRELTTMLFLRSQDAQPGRLLPSALQWRLMFAVCLLSRVFSCT